MKIKDFESNEESDNEDRNFLRTENAEVQNLEAEENIEEETSHIQVDSDDQTVQNLVKAIILHDLESFKTIIVANLNLLEQEFPVDTKRDVVRVGYNILHMLVDEEFLEGLQFLIHNYRDQINIEVAVNEQEVLEDGNENYYEFSKTDKYTVLMLASMIGNLEILNELISADANIDGTNFNEETSLILAARNGHLDIVKILLQKEAKLEAQSVNGGGTALYVALNNSYIDIAKELINAGANVRVKEQCLEPGKDEKIPFNTPLGIMCGFQSLDDTFYPVYRLNEVNAQEVIQELLFTHNISFTQEELAYLKTSSFKTVSMLIKYYSVFQQFIEENVAHNFYDKYLSELSIIDPNFLLKLVDSYLKVKNIDLAVSIDDSKTVNALKLISCTGKVLDGDNDKKIVLIDLIKDDFDLKIIESLVGHYYVCNKIKLNSTNIENYISKLLINISPNMNPLKEHKIKDYNSILFQVKNDLINEAIKISQSLETLEKCLVDMLDSDFNEILTYNKKDLENKGLIKKGLPPKWDLQTKPTAHEGMASNLGLKGRVETNESDNGFEGEIYGSGKILELFLSKLDTVNFEIDASSVTFDIKEFFNGLKILVNQVSYNLTAEAKAKLYSFIETNQNIASEDSAQVAEIEPNIVVDAHAAEMPDNHSTEGNMDLSGDVHTS